MIRLSTLGLGPLVLALGIAFGAAAQIHAQTRTWTNAGGGTFATAGNWSPAIVPGLLDAAGFGINGSYTVSLGSSVTNASARVTSGNVLFDLGASGTARTYSVGTLQIGGTTDPTFSIRRGTVRAQSLRLHDDGLLNVGPPTGFNHSSATLTVVGSLRIESGGRLEVRSEAGVGERHRLIANGDIVVDGGTLRSLGSATIELAAGKTLAVSNGGTLFQNGGFHAIDGKTLHGINGASITYNFLNVAASSGNGAAIFQGPGTAISARFPAGTDDSHIWGAGGGNATVTVRDGATALFRGGLLLASDGSAATSIVTVDGPGARLEQTNVGAGAAPDRIIIGHATAGAATINVRNGGIFTAESGFSGSSRVVLNPTGQINLESGGVFEAVHVERNGGTINMNGGTLRVGFLDGNLSNPAGRLHPGFRTDNVTFIDGNYTQQSAATTQFDIGGIVPGDWSQVGISGNAILGGTIDLRLVNDFVPVLGNSFVVLNTSFGNVAGKFETVQGSLPLPDLGFAVTYTPKEVIVRTAIPGDTNLDDVVNLMDFNTLATHFGQTGRTWKEADFTGDGVVSLQDFNRLAAHFGISAGPEGPTTSDWSALAAAVPEPGAAFLAPLAGAGLIRRRRTSNHEGRRRREGRGLKLRFTNVRLEV